MKRIQESSVNTANGKEQRHSEAPPPNRAGAASSGDEPEVRTRPVVNYSDPMLREPVSYLRENGAQLRENGAQLREVRARNILNEEGLASLDKATKSHAHPPQNEEIGVDVRSTVDIVTARQHGRELAIAVGFSGAEVTLVAAAISEIARNILDHAKSGKIIFSMVNQSNEHGLQVIAQDQGPGIPDLTRAMQYGYSTRGGLGVGLAGVKWLMDDFEIHSEEGRGTRVVMRKWLQDENSLRPEHEDQHAQMAAKWI